MKLSTHIAASLALATILYPVIGWNSIIVFLAGFVIDIDHLFWYYLCYGTASPAKVSNQCYEWRKLGDKVAVRGFLLVFHVIEFALIIGVLAIFFRWALYIFFGLALHQILDIVDRYKHYGEYEPYSIIIFFWKYYKPKKRQASK
ncbi:MAG: hypothetical protein ABIF10_04715 [Candidatus Woesearchaeota archaeon]